MPKVILIQAIQFRSRHYAVGDEMDASTGDAVELVLAGQARIVPEAAPAKLPKPTNTPAYQE